MTPHGLSIMINTIVHATAHVSHTKWDSMWLLSMWNLWFNSGYLHWLSSLSSAVTVYMMCTRTWCDVFLSVLLCVLQNNNKSKRIHESSVDWPPFSDCVFMSCMWNRIYYQVWIMRARHILLVNWVWTYLFALPLALMMLTVNEFDWTEVCFLIGNRQENMLETHKTLFLILITMFGTRCEYIPETCRNCFYQP